MPYKKKDNTKRNIWRRLVAGHRFPAIRLNNSGQTPEERKQPQKRTTWKKGSRIIGVTDADKIKADRYAIVPSTIGALCVDIDTVPGIDKAEFRLQNIKECQRQLNEYVDGELFARCPSLKAKVVHRSWSESKKGLHLLFWNPDFRVGKTKEPYGDCIGDSGYFIPSDPKQLLLDLNRDREPLTEAEINFLSPEVSCTAANNPDPIINSSLIRQFTGFPAAEDLYSLFKDRPLQKELVMRTVKEACGDYWHRPLSLNPDYPWLGEELAIQFAGLPIEIYDAYVHWWMIAKILKHINPGPAMFHVFDSLSALSWNYGRTHEMWNAVTICPSQPVNMGRITSLNRLFDGEILINSNPKQMDFRPVDDWFEANCEITDDGWTAKDVLWRHFSASNPDSGIGQKSFSSHLRMKYKLETTKQRERRGFAGPVLR